jgi:hypothetical protein
MAKIRLPDLGKIGRKTQQRKSTKKHLPCQIILPKMSCGFFPGGSNFKIKPTFSHLHND